MENIFHIMNPELSDSLTFIQKKVLDYFPYLLIFEQNIPGVFLKDKLNKFFAKISTALSSIQFFIQYFVILH